MPSMRNFRSGSVAEFEQFLYELAGDWFRSRLSRKNRDSVAHLEFCRRPFQPTVRKIGEDTARALMLHAAQSLGGAQNAFVYIECDSHNLILDDVLSWRRTVDRHRRIRCPHDAVQLSVVEPVQRAVFARIDNDISRAAIRMRVHDRAALRAVKLAI